MGAATGHFDEFGKGRNERLRRETMNLVRRAIRWWSSLAPADALQNEPVALHATREMEAFGGSSGTPRVLWSVSGMDDFAGRTPCSGERAAGLSAHGSRGDRAS